MMREGGITTGDWRAFEEFVEDVMSSEGIPGLSVAFARDGEIVYSRGFGWADRAAGLAAEARTVYGVASVTKSFTAMAIMKLHEQARLRLDDPVQTHLPKFRLSGENPPAVTIHHLLSHTSGLPPLAARRGLAVGGGRRLFDAPPSRGQLLEYLASQPYRRVGPPGARFSYSNDGFALLGAIVEELAGQPYEAFVQEQILAPLGLRRSTFDPAVLDTYPAVTQLYERSPDGGVEESPGWPRWGIYQPSGALRSNVLDLLRYLEVYRCAGAPGSATARLLGERSLKTMTTSVIEFLPGRFYAYGFEVEPLPEAGVTLIGHSGNQKGTAAYAGYVPERGLTGAVQMNLGDMPAADVWRAGVHAMLGLDPLAQRATVLDAPPAAAGEYAGSYRSDEGVVVTLESGTGGALRAVIDGQEAELGFVARDLAEVRLRASRKPVLFLRDQEGRVWAMRYGLRVICRS